MKGIDNLMGRTIGVDLGTTNSAAAYLVGGEPTILVNAEGGRTTPSVVAFAKGSGDVVAGELARRQTVTNVDRTIPSVKRHMGTDWTIDIDGKNYTPQEISARILQKIKRDAEAYLGETVDSAVITVPAYYNDAQRQATKEAGEIAGLKVLRIINEPTAAALAYGVDTNNEDELVLVWDLGGGTFDVSLLEVGKDEDGFVSVSVIATNGDNHLGGDDWDKALRNYILEEFSAANGGHDLSGDAAAMQRVKDAAEQAKKDLSSAAETHISLPYLAMQDGAPLNLDMTLTRNKFEEITKALLERAKAPFKNVLADAKKTITDIHTVVLVGGSTRMPAVVDVVRELSGKEPNKSVNPDEVVALGAAIQAGIINGERKDVLLIDVTPLDLGIGISGGLMEKIIERNTAIPSQRSQTFTTAVDGQRAVTVSVYQGPREFVVDNHKLGDFDLAVAPAPAGRPQIQVTFDIDANGIVTVTAKDLGTGKEANIQISGAANLSEAEIEAMIKDAEANAASDKERRELIELRNVVDGVVSEAKATVEEFREQVSAELISEIEGNIAALEAEVKSSSATSAGIKAAAETLNASLTKIGEELYQTPEPAAAAPTQEEPAEEAPTEEVIDGEIIEDAEIVE